MPFELSWPREEGAEVFILPYLSIIVVVVQSLSCVWLFVTPWTVACQASLSFNISWSLLRLMSTETVMPSNHPLLPPSPPAFNLSQHEGLISNQSALWIRWPKCWSFSISPSNEYSGLISFMMDWLSSLQSKGLLKSLLQHHSSKASIITYELTCCRIVEVGVCGIFILFKNFFKILIGG